MNRAVIFITCFTISLQAYAKEAVLSFSSALDTIVNRSLDVAIQKNTSQAVYFQNYPNRLFYLPDLSIHAHHTLSNTFRDQWTSTDRHNARINAKLNLFRFGADLAAMRAAKVEQKKMESLIEKFKFDAEHLGAQAIFSFIESKKNLSIIDQALNTRSSILKIAQQRYQKGLLPLQEVEKITIDLKNDQARRHDAEVRLAQSQALLQELLGHDRIVSHWPWKSTLLSSPQWTKLKAISKVITHRLDYRIASFEVSASRERVNESWGNLWPQVDLEVQYSLVGEDIFNKSFDHEFAGLVSITIPVFDRLNRYGHYRSTLLERVSSEAALDKVRRQASAQIELKNREFSLSLRSVKSRASILQSARKLYQDNAKRFRLGQISANDLALDETRLLDSERLAIKGWRSIHQSVIDLCHVQGKRLKTCLAGLQVK